MSDSTTRAKARYIDLCGGTINAAAFCADTLSSGCQLPACARAVIAGGEPTERYWSWLAAKRLRAMRADLGGE